MTTQFEIPDRTATLHASRDADGGAIVVASGQAGTGTTTVTRLLGALSRRRHLEHELLDAGARLGAVLAAIEESGADRLLAVTSTGDASLTATYALIKAVDQQHPGLRIDLLVNRCGGRAGEAAFDAIASAARKFLGRGIRYAGAVPDATLLSPAGAAGAHRRPGPPPELERALGAVLHRLFDHAPAAHGAHAILEL